MPIGREPLLASWTTGPPPPIRPTVQSFVSADSRPQQATPCYVPSGEEEEKKAVPERSKGCQTMARVPFQLFFGKGPLLTRESRVKGAVSLLVREGWFFFGFFVSLSSERRRGQLKCSPLPTTTPPPTYYSIGKCQPGNEMTLPDPEQEETQSHQPAWVG